MDHPREGLSASRVWGEPSGPAVILPPSGGACVRWRLTEISWTVAHQAPLSMGFSRQGYWSEFPCPPPGDIPNPGIKTTSLKSPALAGGFFTASTTREAHFTHSGTPLQHSCLENPMDGGALWAAVHGVTKSRTRLSDFTCTFLHWRRKWQPTPVFLPGESQGRGSLVGCRLWGRTESGHD